MIVPEFTEDWLPTSDRDWCRAVSYGLAKLTSCLSTGT
jgi:hypothetical protein